ncbi:MAG: hypothetical protein C0483_03860 [Pirellula sp.]|nr:hypothetical protein [Pirellula sp.]
MNYCRRRPMLPSAQAEAEVPMNRILLSVPMCAGSFILASMFIGCPAAQSEPEVSTPVMSADLEPVDTARGALVYVPIYSQIHYEDNTRTLELTATLTIHNVNPDQTITVTKADYHDTSGKRIHPYVTQPLELRPLETKHLIIEKSNTAGGLGANFLVEWRSEKEVGMPIVEAVMINAAHNLGIAFTSQGKVIGRSRATTK